MKKLTVAIATALLLSISLPTPSKAASESTPTSLNMTEAAKAAETNRLLTRLDEINAMDKSTLTKPEKRQLRKEVRSINKSMKTISGGVYLSVGAIIIIVLLLILLL